MFKKVACSLGVAGVVGLFVLFFPRAGQSAPPATGLASCHTVSAANIPYDTIVECPSGEILTGGGGTCYGSGGNWESFLVSSHPSGKGWGVRCENLKSGAKQLSAETYAICCKP